MGAEFFSPFLPAIIPHLLSCTALDDGCSVEEVTDERPVDDVDGVDVVTLEVRGLGKRMITMNTFLMEQKSLACNMLFQVRATNSHCLWLRSTNVVRSTLMIWDPHFALGL